MRRRVSALSLAFTLALGTTAHAQGGPSDLTLNADAVARGQHGLEAFRSGDWAGAYESFHQAETLVHSPVFLLYMARARAEQGANPEALDLYARVVSERLPDSAPEAWTQAVVQAASEREALRRRMLGEPTPSEPVLVAPPPAATPRAARSSGISRESRRAATIAAGAVGAAGVVLGVTAGIVALVRFRDMEDRCGPAGCNRADKGRYDSVMTWSRVSDLGFVVGGAGLATAAVFVWVVPSSGAQGRTAALSVTGRF